MEKFSFSPSTFFGPLGASSFLGSSSFFLGTAIGPMSPWGPPASGAGFCEGVGVGVAAGWLFGFCANPSDVASHRAVANIRALRYLDLKITLEDVGGLLTFIKSILALP